MMKRTNICLTNLKLPNLKKYKNKAEKEFKTGKYFARHNSKTFQI